MEISDEDIWKLIDAENIKKYSRGEISFDQLVTKLRNATMITLNVNGKPKSVIVELKPGYSINDLTDADLAEIEQSIETILGEDSDNS